MATPQLLSLDTGAGQECASNVARMARILLPVDFSEPCSRVVRHASKFARCFGSEVTLLHVQDGAPDSARERLESFGRVTLEGLSVRRVLLRSNDPASAIAETSRRNRVGMILMPTYGTQPVSQAHSRFSHGEDPARRRLSRLHGRPPGRKDAFRPQAHSEDRVRSGSRFPRTKRFGVGARFRRSTRRGRYRRSCHHGASQLG